jgi:hypothetical protein
MRKNDIEFPPDLPVRPCGDRKPLLGLDAFHSPFDNLLKNWERTAFHYVAAMDSLHEIRKNLLLTGLLAG